MPKGPVVHSLGTTHSLGFASSAFRIAACHFPGKSSKSFRVEQRPVELAALFGAHLDQRRVADSLSDAGG